MCLLNYNVGKPHSRFITPQSRAEVKNPFSFVDIRMSHPNCSGTRRNSFPANKQNRPRNLSTHTKMRTIKSALFIALCLLFTTYATALRKRSPRAPLSRFVPMGDRARVWNPPVYVWPSDQEETMDGHSTVQPIPRSTHSVLQSEIPWHASEAKVGALLWFWDSCFNR